VTIRTSQRRAHDRQSKIRKIARRLRKEKWHKNQEPRLLRDKHLTFDGRLGGPSVEGIPRLTDTPLTVFWDEATEIFEAAS